MGALEIGIGRGNPGGGTRLPSDHNCPKLPGKPLTRVDRPRNLRSYERTRHRNINSRSRSRRRVLLTTLHNTSYAPTPDACQGLDHRSLGLSPVQHLRGRQPLQTVPDRTPLKAKMPREWRGYHPTAACSRFLEDHAQSTRISIGHSYFGHRGVYGVLDGGIPYGNRLALRVDPKGSWRRSKELLRVMMQREPWGNLGYITSSDISPGE